MKTDRTLSIDYRGKKVEVIERILGAGDLWHTRILKKFPNTPEGREAAYRYMEKERQTN